MRGGAPEVPDDVAVGQEQDAVGDRRGVRVVGDHHRRLAVARRRSGAAASRISALVVESRLPVGSSANTTVGRETSARAIATRCCWPPESSDGRWLRRSPRPTVRDQLVEPRRVRLARRRSRAGGAMFSSAVSIGSRLKNWKMKPMCSRRSWSARASPSVGDVASRRSQTSPAVGRSSPARICMSVDLPEPDGPMIAVSLPLGDRRARRRAARRRPCRRRRSGGVTSRRGRRGGRRSVAWWGW